MARPRHLFLTALLPVVAFSLGCGREVLDVGHSGPPGTSDPTEACEAHSDETKLVAQEYDRTILSFAVDAEYTYYLSEPRLIGGVVSSRPPDDSPATVLKRVARKALASEELARSFSTLQTRSTLMEDEVGIALAGDWVYWTATRDDNSGNALFRVPKSGGAKQRVTDDSDSPSGYLVVDTAQNIYFTNRGEGRPRLVRIASDGTRHVVVAEGSDDIASFAIDDREVFWTMLPRLGAAGVESAGIVQATPLEGGASRTLFGPAPNTDFRVRDVSATDVYLTSIVDGARVDRASRLPKAGGQPVPIMSEQTSASLLILDGADVVWTSANEVRRLRSAAAVSETLAFDASDVTQLRTSACDIYWNESLKALGGSAIYRRSR